MMKKLLLQTSSKALLLLMLQEVPLPALASVLPDRLVLQKVEITLTGQVTSPSGEALPGVTVLVKGTQVGTTPRQTGLFN